MQIGRRILYSDVETVTMENVIQIIQDVEPDFLANVFDCNRLLAIEAGNMPIARTKEVRPEIDVQTVDSIAHEITVFKEGYHWANPISFVQRGMKDSGKESENKAVTLLNECYSAENLGKKQHTLGHFVEICGIGFVFVDIKMDWEEGDSYFKYETLDPRYAFIVRSSRYADHRPLLGVTFREDKQGNKYYTAFSKDRRYEISNRIITNGDEVKNEWGFESRSGEINPLGMIPIIETERADDRMGVFEREIPEMERLNLILSDIGNDIDQETQMIWHANDVDFPHVLDSDGNPTEETEKPKSNEWVATYTSRDGRVPFIKPLTTNYNYQGLLNNYVSARSLILQRTYTPQRTDTSGGSTGSAMSDATGWSAAEQVAASQQLLIEAAKMEEVKVVLQAIKKNPNIPADSPLLDLKYIDIKPNVMRQKTYELSVKSTAFANYVSHGIYGLHALKAINGFDDVAQVWADSKDLIEEYQKSTFGEKEEVQKSSDLPEYQIGNSPLIDGMEKEQPKENDNDENNAKKETSKEGKNSKE